MDWLIHAIWGLRFRGKVRLVSPLAPRSGRHAARVFGSRVELDLTDYVQRMMYLGCFERDETRLVQRALSPGGVFVDVGANAGYFTLLAANRVGTTGRVLAIEPDTLLFGQLETTVRDNRLSHVTALNLALGRVAGTSLLFVPPHSHADHVRDARLGAGERVRPPTRRCPR